MSFGAFSMYGRICMSNNATRALAASPSAGATGHAVASHDAAPTPVAAHPLRLSWVKTRRATFNDMAGRDGAPRSLQLSA